MQARNELVDMVMTRMLTTFDADLYRDNRITDTEVVLWAFEHEDLIRNTIVNPDTMAHLINICIDETLFWSTILVGINSLKQHLIRQRRQRRQERAVVGGTKKSKHRRSKKY